MITVDEVAARVEATWARIESAGGTRERVRLVAVTKGFDAAVARTAVAAGLSDLGESYAQELAAKAPEVGDAARWHFIGAIQRRKVRTIAGLVHLWHGVARVEEADEIAARAPRDAVLVQVNVTGEPQRNGCARADVEAVVVSCAAAGVDVRGLMAVAPAGPASEARPHFRWLAKEAARLGLPELSMGMSGDLEVAVEEGATIVRVGSALFGPRPVTRLKR